MKTTRKKTKVIGQETYIKQDTGELVEKIEKGFQMKTKANKLIMKVSVFAIMLTALLRPMSVEASWMRKSQTLIGKSLVGLKVVQVDFYAEGYSYTNSGKVTDKWFDTWYIFPNTVSAVSTWTASHPRGEYARGSVRIGVGINSKYGVIGLAGGTKTFSILF